MEAQAQPSWNSGAPDGRHFDLTVLVPNGGRAPSVGAVGENRRVFVPVVVALVPVAAAILWFETRSSSAPIRTHVAALEVQNSLPQPQLERPSSLPSSQAQTRLVPSPVVESGTRADARTRINSAEVDREVESASHDTIERFDNNLRLYEERRAQLSNELAQGKKDEAAATGIARWLQASGATDAVRGVLCSHSVCELELRQDQPLEETLVQLGASSSSVF